MAETNFFQLFKATWAQNGTTDRISAAQYSTGWAYIGSLPPTVEQFNAVQQFTDQKLTWVYRHLEAVAALTGRELTAAGSDAISYAFQNLNASRLTAGTVPVERLPEKAPAMTVGAAVKWETPRNISISGGATARAKLFDGSADVALEMTGLSMSAATGVLLPVNGGTGLNWVPPGNYLVGNGTATMTFRTPAQVFNDLGIAQYVAQQRRVVVLNIESPVDANMLTLPETLYKWSYFGSMWTNFPNIHAAGYLQTRLLGSALCQELTLVETASKAVCYFRFGTPGGAWQPWRVASAFSHLSQLPNWDAGDVYVDGAGWHHWNGASYAPPAPAIISKPSTARIEPLGWWRCGDTGLIRQWGLSRGAGDGEAWVTFPIPFPSVCLGGVVTHAGRFNVLDDAGVGLIDPSTTGAYLRNGAWNSVMLYWEVWGK